MFRDNKTSATEKELSPKLPKGSKISQQVTFTSKFVEHASEKRSNAASISAFIKATVEEVKGLTKDNNEKKLMDTLPQTAYDATITSLERARRCSRLQMIRIVQETVEPVVTEEDFEKWKYEHKELQKRVNSLEESTKELKETTEAHSKSINTAQHSTTKEDFDNQNSEHQKLQGKIESLEERTKELKETTEGHSKSIDVLKLKMNFISHNEVDD
ncbi:hypothetical protein APSETT445_004982 [Aspergillus pseudonomiae]